jgi:peptidoglycan/xylan/chitin deacetylase (PgdA/CDA1 family)
MPDRVRRALRKGLAASGLLKYVIGGRMFNGVMVVCYHAIRRDDQPDGVMPFEGLHVRRALFREHCRILSELCTPISLAQWRAAQSGGPALATRPVLVTMDDGYRSALTEGLTVLEEFQVPAALFVCTDPIARGEMFWYDSVASAKGEHAVAELKRATYSEWREVFERARRPVSPDAPTAPLSATELQRLAAHPLIEIGGHSHRHPILARADQTAQREEIVDNLNAIEEWTGRRPAAFAYPQGRRDYDFTRATEALVSGAGIDLAFGTDPGIAGPACRALSQPRFTMTSGLSGAHLLQRLAWDWH